MNARGIVNDLHKDELEAIHGYVEAIPVFAKSNPAFAAQLKVILEQEKEHASILAKAGKRLSGVVKSILGSKKADTAWDGTEATGFVTDSGKPARECHNCKFYKHDLCSNVNVMADDEARDEAEKAGLGREGPGGTVPVKDGFCCNHFKRPKK
jgi:hypothetical protein